MEETATHEYGGRHGGCLVCPHTMEVYGPHMSYTMFTEACYWHEETSCMGYNNAGKGRVVCSGNSAGMCVSLWVGTGQSAVGNCVTNRMVV